MAGTVVLSGIGARAVSAREQFTYVNGVPYHLTSHGWQVYHPTQHRAAQHRPTNNARAAAARANGGSTGSTKSKSALAAAPVNMNTEVQSLKDRHAAVASTLPNDIKRLDKEVQPIVEKLPDVAQFGYYSTVEDYKSLSTDEQDRVKYGLQSLSGISENDRPKFIESASKPFDAMKSNVQELQNARKQPHMLFYQLRNEVAKFNAGPATPAPKAATTPAATTPADPATAAATTPTTPAKKKKPKVDKTPQ